MKVQCIGARGIDLPEEMLKQPIWHPNSQFSLTVGREYTVWAMKVWDKQLMIMVLGSHSWPSWYPIELFAITDGTMPPGWEFAVHKVRSTHDDAVWGYPTLIRDPDHQIELSDRRKTAREIFLRESGVSGWNDETKRFVE